MKSAISRPILAARIVLPPGSTFEFVNILLTQDTSGKDKKVVI
jgi:hypothetical protein